MEVVSFKLYQRKLVVDDLPAMFYNSRGRERVGLAGGRAGVGGGGGGCVGVGVCVGEGGVWRGEGAGGTDRQTERDLHSEFICFSTVLQVTAAEVKPI